MATSTSTVTDKPPPSALLIEAFYGGSHKQLIDVLFENIPGCEKFTLPAKKWHWRARTAALHFSQTMPENDNYRVLFCSAVLNLAELVALRPDFAKLKKVLYFHENQLVYPVRKQQDRDFQYGYNQIISCLVADHVLFNSRYNMESFLNNISTFLKLIPDHRPKGLADKIRPKCRVLHFPIMFPPKCATDSLTYITELGCNLADYCDRDGKDQTPLSQNKDNQTEAVSVSADAVEEQHKTSSDSDPNVENQRKKLCTMSPHKNISAHQSIDTTSASHSTLTQDSVTYSANSRGDVQNRNMDITDHSSTERPLHIVWPHRWEHDKDPDTFFQAMFSLTEEGVPFHLSVLGETFTDVPDIFSGAQSRLSRHIKHWGYLPSKADYYTVLRNADVVVSTAKHEFFGVAMLESVHLGCYPLCPNDLVYPEIFPKECLYNTPNQLTKKLKQFAKRPDILRRKSVQVDTDQYSWASLEPSFQSLLLPETQKMEEMGT